MMYDPDADRGFLTGFQEALERSGTGNVGIEEFDMHINDKVFAEKIDALIKG